MKWKFVFNSNLLPYGDTFDMCKEFIKTTGYKFFIFNGLVYSISGENTGITISDMV